VDCGIILKCILRIKLRGYILSMYVCMYEWGLGHIRPLQRDHHRSIKFEGADRRGPNCELAVVNTIIGLWAPYNIRNSVDSWRTNSLSITNSDSLSGILIIWVAATTFAFNITTVYYEHWPEYQYRLVWTLAEVFFQAVLNTGRSITTRCCEYWPY
jgi:hypothetical protein